MVILGLSLFLLGVEVAISPIGRLMANAVARSGRLAAVLSVTFVLGFFLTMAEPDLLIYAEQVNTLTSGVITNMLLLVVVSLGVAVFLTVGMMRILRNWRLRWVLLVAYGLVLILALVAPSQYLAISFDASGATTGPLTVPVVLALATGVSSMKRDSKRSEADAFGLVAVACVGAILALQIMSLVLPLGDLPRKSTLPKGNTTEVWAPFGAVIPHELTSVAVGLAPLVVLFLVGNFTVFKLASRYRRRILSGMVMAFLGLSLFLIGANGGFMEVGRLLGSTLAAQGTAWILLVIAFALGFLAVLAEPAVNVLTSQVEDVTSGSIRRSTVMGAMALGVGLAVLLSTLRLFVTGLELWHLLLGGYLIAVFLTFFSSELFGGLAYDGGGVAPGPMVTTFVLAFAQGAASGTPGADVVVDGLGLISLVALMPPIVLQLLGIIFQAKSKPHDTGRARQGPPQDSPKNVGPGTIEEKKET